VPVSLAREVHPALKERSGGLKTAVAWIMDGLHAVQKAVASSFK
jgi:hypothetical protein